MGGPSSGPNQEFRPQGSFRSLTFHLPIILAGRDSQNEDASKFYHESDLRIGSYIRVFNRDMLLHDCDDFTRNYYRTK